MLRSLLNARLHVQVIAWSGAGLDTYAGFLPNGSRAYMTGMPDELPETIVPEVATLFGRQVAADNTSMVPADNTTWVPQVCLFFSLFLCSSCSALPSSSASNSGCFCCIMP